ncbi:MAG: ABC transporter permease, partial [Longimicrobiales bacterium]
MNAVPPDLRYAARTLARSPAFTIVALLTLSIGIGANTAIFSVISSVLLRPLPYEAPERVVTVWNAFADQEEMKLSAPELIDYRREVESFE